MPKAPPNHGKDWTAADVRQLRQLARKMSTQAAAKQLGRTKASVAVRASVEGISFRPGRASVRLGARPRR
jgi:hypothetical protein